MTFPPIRTRFAVLATALAILLSLLAAPPASADVTNYGPKSGTVSSTTSPRYISYTFPVSGASTIDATLSWPASSGADLNIIIKNPAGTMMASTSTAVPNPEQLTYTTPSNASGNWKIVAFARLGTATYNLGWSVTTGPVANRAPAASADTATTAVNTPVTVNVLANDTDADGPGAMSVGSVTNGTNGTAANNGTNVTYTPSSSTFSGTDTFTYTACDTDGACSPATNVTVTVGEPDPDPDPDSDEGTTTSYGPKSAKVSSASAPRYVSYAFPVSGASTIEAELSWPGTADLNIVIKNPAGTAVANTTNPTRNPETLTYTTPASATGNWKIFALARKGTATFTLNWSVRTGPPPPPPNQAPKTVADTGATDPGRPVSIWVLSTDSDPDGPAPLTIGTVTDGQRGKAVATTVNGEPVAQYTPNDSTWNGVDEFTYTACDGAGACSAPTKVTITVGNPPPVANDDTATATTGVAKTIAVLANDSGPGPLGVDRLTQPTHGTVTNNGTDVTYTSAADYAGPDSFTYSTCVASNCSSPATVSVTVNRPTPPPPPGSNYLRTFTAQNIGTKNSFTQDEANAVARNFDLIVATPAAFKGKVPGMRAANPKLKVLGYVNAAFVGSSQGPSSGNYPAEWYMRDANGNPVQSKYNNYMMNISNPSWIDNRKNTCKNTANASGYDGCSLDMLGTAPLDPGYTKTFAINPRTNERWTPTDYNNAISALAEAVKNFAAPLTVSGNGLRAGNAYFDHDAPAKKLFNGIEVGMAEAFVRPGPTGINFYRNESQWKQDVDMLADADSLPGNHGVATLTKIWTEGTTAQKDVVHEYTLATFLMGTGGKSMFYFSYEDRVDVTRLHPWWSENIGTPAGDYANYKKVGNVYVRTFSNGIVIVNPTTAAGTFTLPPGEYRDINTGATKSGTLSVPVHAGWVLLKK